MDPINSIKWVIHTATHTHTYTVEKLLSAGAVLNKASGPAACDSGFEARCEVGLRQARGQPEFDWRVANVINEIAAGVSLWEWIDPALICAAPRSTSNS